MEINQPDKIFVLAPNNYLSKYKIFFQGVFLFTLIGLAFSRWMPGGNPLNPETGSRAWIEISILLVAFLLVLFFWGPKTIIAGFRSPSFVFLFSFGIWALVTSLWSPNPVLTVGKSAELILVLLLIASIAYQTSKSNTSFMKIILVSLLIIVAFLFVINLANYQTLFPIRYFGTRARFILGLNHPNATTMYFSSIVLISAYLFFKQPRIQIKLLYMMLILINLVLIEMTDSRTTMVSVLVGILLIAFFQIRSKRLMYLLALSGFTLVILLGIILTSGKFDHSLFVYLGNHPDFFTLNGRTELWKTALENTSGLNTGGLGYYNSRFLFLNELGEGWGFNLHNSYLEVFFTTGWIGTFLASLFYFSTIPQMKFMRKFSLPIIFLLYLSMEGMMESRLFTPNIPFTIAVGFIFYQQFLIQNSDFQKRHNMHESLAQETPTNDRL